METHSPPPGRLPTLAALAALTLGALAGCGGSREDLSGAAGMPVPMSMGGSVYRDDNGNGRRDADEHPLTGARVSIRRQDPATGRCDKDEKSAAADDEGKFAFSNLAAGAYCLGATADGMTPSSYAGDQTAPMNLLEGASATLDIGMASTQP